MPTFTLSKVCIYSALILLLCFGFNMFQEFTATVENPESLVPREPHRKRMEVVPRTLSRTEKQEQFQLICDQVTIITVTMLMTRSSHLKDIYNLLVGDDNGQWQRRTATQIRDLIDAIQDSLRLTVDDLFGLYMERELQLKKLYDLDLLPQNQHKLLVMLDAEATLRDFITKVACRTARFLELLHRALPIMQSNQDHCLTPKQAEEHLNWDFLLPHVVDLKTIYRYPFKEKTLWFAEHPLFNELKPASQDDADPVTLQKLWPASIP